VRAELPQFLQQLDRLQRRSLDLPDRGDDHLRRRIWLQPQWLSGRRCAPKRHRHHRGHRGSERRDPRRLAGGGWMAPWCAGGGGRCIRLSWDSRHACRSRRVTDSRGRSSL
jgi:hypothetical protein